MDRKPSVRAGRRLPILDRPLWTCPDCGARFVNRNNWHSCGEATLGDWKARMGPRAARLYERFVQLITACGEFHVAPAKTRIAFLGRVRFAGITSLSEQAMTCSFSLPYPVDSHRFAKVEEVVPGWWVHRMRITEPDQLDAQVQTWVRESYRLMGMQERLSGMPRRPAARHERSETSPRLTGRRPR
jgi:hypothetical protein